MRSNICELSIAVLMVCTCTVITARVDYLKRARKQYRLAQDVMLVYACTSTAGIDIAHNAQKKIQVLLDLPGLDQPIPHLGKLQC